MISPCPKAHRTVATKVGASGEGGQGSPFGFLRVLKALNDQIFQSEGEIDLQRLVDQTVAAGDELTFGALYVVDGERSTLRLEASARLPPEAGAFPKRVELGLPNTLRWPFAELLHGGRSRVLDALGTQVLAVPVSLPGDTHAKAVFLAGLAAGGERSGEAEILFDLLAAGLGGALTAMEAQSERRRRSEFEQMIGIVAHDLRNPLHAIRLSASLGHRAAPPASRLGRTFDRILSSANRAVRMITDLLDFTSVRRGGGIPIDREQRREELHKVVARAVEEVLITRPERSVVVESKSDCTGAWDGDRIQQVVQNLLGNALQHTVEGTPVTLRTLSEGQWVVLEVHNGGPAISAADLPVLFEPFRRGSSARPDSGRSLGLGLYITRHIVEAHGGTVEVSSDAVHGTLFRVRLPCDPS